MKCSDERRSCTAIPPRALCHELIEEIRRFCLLLHTRCLASGALDSFRKECLVLKHLGRSLASQLRLEITIDGWRRSRCFSVDCNIAGILPFAKENDFYCQIVPVKYLSASVFNITLVKLRPYRYRLEYGLGNVNNAQTISLSFPPRAFLTKCVAAFLSSTTKRP